MKSLLALACLLFCAAFAPALAGAAEPGAIEGTVTEVGTGDPIAGTLVKVNGPQEGEAVTDGAGAYKIEGLAEGTYEVDFTGLSCAGGAGVDCTPKFAERLYDKVKPQETPTPVTVEAEKTTEDIDAELELNGTIEGTLTDPQNYPIANGFVCVNSHTQYHPECGFSDSSGEYAFPDLPPGEFDIQFTGRACAGAGCDVEACELGQGCPRTYIGHYWEHGLSEEEATLVTVTAGGVAAGKDATLPPGGQIKGKVTIDALGAPPLAGFVVCASPETTPAVGECVETDANGEYAIEGLDDSGWQVEFKEACPESGCLGTYETQVFHELIALEAPEVKPGVNASIKELLPQVPAFTSKPVVTGIPVVSRPLACSEGTWTGHPTAIRYAWLRDGIPISGAESKTYVTTPQDQGNDVTCEVEVSNSAGGIEEFSENVHIGPELAPAFTTQPSLSGTATVGSTLTCTEGAAENYPLSTSYAWLRDGAPIAGQAGTTYNVTNEDEGAMLTCRVTMANGAGSASASSNGLSVPPRPEEHKDNPTSGSGSGGSSSSTGTATTPPPSSGTATATGTATASGKASAARSISIQLSCPGKGDCKVTLKLTAEQKTKNAKGKTVTKQVVIGSGSVTVGAGKVATIAVPLNAKGESLLAKAGKAGLKVKLTGTGVKHRTLTVH